MLDFLFTKIPFTGDLNENETVLRFAFNLNSLCKPAEKSLNILFYIEPEKIQPYMQQVTLTCLKVLVDEKCDEIPQSFKQEVGRFIKNVIVPTQLPLLQ
jgi:hypothetical protein